MEEIPKSLIISIIGNPDDFQPDSFAHIDLGASLDATTAKIQSLESDISKLENERNHQIEEWNATYKGKHVIDDGESELISLQQSFQKIEKEINDFYLKNGGGIDVLNEYYQSSNLLNIAKMILQKQNLRMNDIQHLINVCDENGYDNMKTLLQQKLNDIKGEKLNILYEEIKNHLEKISVNNQQSIKTIFLSNNEHIGDSRTLNKLIDDVRSIDQNWDAEVAKIAENVFVTRFIFHCRTSGIQTGSSTIAFIFGLLRITIQSALAIFTYAEKYAKNSILEYLIEKLVTQTSKQILIANDGTCIFYRNIFEQSVIFDEWIDSFSFMKIDYISSLMFEKIGKEWMSLEVQTLKSLITNLVNNGNNDFPISITHAFSTLFELFPSILSSKERQIFIKNCVLHADKYAFSILKESFNTTKSNKQKTLIINTYHVLGIQLSEMFELDDCCTKGLNKDSLLCQSQVKEFCKEFGNSIINIFEREGKPYLIQERMTWQNGSVTPSLYNVLSIISNILNEIKEDMEYFIYENIYLPFVVQAIDNKIYTMMVKRINWSKKESINQFEIDLEKMIEIFGEADLRLLRSAKIVLTQKEEQYLNLEIPENDIQYFIKFNNYYS